MVKKYTMGAPINTEAVVKAVEASAFESFPFEHRTENGRFIFSFKMADEDIIYGLGEAPRGINKRGWVYQSYCSDDPFHTETKQSLYAAHNFLIFQNYGIFIDFPARIRWDIGYTNTDTAEITIDGADFDIYIIEQDKPLDIVREFRGLIGQSYIPPFWAFGYQQCRWSYHNAEAVENVIKSYDDAEIPLDCVYLDIDYMERYKDFTVNREAFPNFEEFVADKKARNIHLIPIIDAGVKKEDGYDVYEEGRKNGYFCKTADGSDFAGGVWPGIVGFPDFLRKDVREWFGSKYKFLTDMGIDGFWNDMNEPAIFYSEQGLQKALDEAAALKGENLELSRFFHLKDVFMGLSNSQDDYASIYHEIDGKTVNHQRVHNIYGASMTKAAGEYFEKTFGKEKILMFSRASYIGAHRTSGIWFGDNHSWWSHILLCLKMLPSANMCGFLYCGADLGGFNENATRDLVLRFLALGAFTPLMRNHSALGTRDQECYRFEKPGDFRDVIQARYRLIPYLYRTFRRASEENDMIFRPLSFDYPDDKIARECETQLMLGEECMIAPVYEQNVSGRYVYLPEDMTFVKLSGEKVTKQELAKGVHYVEVALNEVPLFIKKGMSIELCKPAMRTALLDTENLETI
ncbi:glycoside hydrolase family 31 protein [Ruminococcus sp.]|uniref:glycoside hydrolase family 31 protein n=1 Tax=Ruminococcus sp. TaxID=41978 RepID=UPI002E763174|nr:TIM-barrel domain-containing protein [Ruminococcus sp.]MEE1263117.1 glycoside hydrolase family 31 protein [Ruminococcus sp.]